MSLGKTIKRLRLERHWTLGRLQIESGVAKSYLSRIERDQHPNMSAKILAQIAKALTVSMDYLCTEAGWQPPPREISNPSPEERKLIGILHEIRRPQVRYNLLKMLTEFAKAWRDIDLMGRQPPLRMVPEQKD